MSLPEFFKALTVGTILNAQIQGEDINSGKLITIDIIGRITGIESLKDRYIVVEGYTYRITWYLNARNSIERIARRSTANGDKIVRQIATEVEIEDWVDGDNRGPDKWRPIYTLHVWEDAPLPDADKTSGFCWKNI